MAQSPVRASVDLQANGLQHGHLILPHSSHASAWGHVMLPITVVKNGDGPTALLTGGNHGDEYEGVTALLKLAHGLKPEAIQGRVIILPMMNAPAVRAGKRISPLDGGNLNRAFPGDPEGSVTEQIADYVNRYLIPECDLALDIHSGGSSLAMVPFAATHDLADPAQARRCRQAVAAFGAPWSVMMTELEGRALYDTAVEQQGKTFVTTELGGGGTTTPYTQAIADRGVANLLYHQGILLTPPEPAPMATRWLTIADDNHYLVSEHSGLLELTVELGESVTVGQPLARVYGLARSGDAPVVYRAPVSGMLVGRRHPARVGLGDVMALLAG